MGIGRCTGEFCQGVGFRVKGFFKRPRRFMQAFQLLRGYKLRGMGTTLGLPNPSRLPFCWQGLVFRLRVWGLGLWRSGVVG